MKTSLRAGAILFTSILFSCQRELYFDNSIPVQAAVYTFNLGNDSCAGFQINGIYQAGVALSDSNSVTFPINVAEAGTYKISSLKANGVLFSDSGSFSATGIQEITLKGSGVPSDTGAYLFKTAAGGCDFTINFTRPLFINSANYIMAGAPDRCTGFNVAGIYRLGTLLDSSLNYVTVSVNVISIGSYNISTQEANNMRFFKSGVFTNLGNNIVRLVGHGSPFRRGNDIFTVGVFPANCSFTVTVVD